MPGTRLHGHKTPDATRKLLTLIYTTTAEFTGSFMQDWTEAQQQTAGVEGSPPCM